MTLYLYAIQCGDFVKIGYSASPLYRAHGIASMSPYGAKLLRVTPGGPIEETMVHRLLEDHHHSHEWFHLCPAVRAVIEQWDLPVKKKSGPKPRPRPTPPKLAPCRTCNDARR